MALITMNFVHFGNTDLYHRLSCHKHVQNQRTQLSKFYKGNRKRNLSYD